MAPPLVRGRRRVQRQLYGLLFLAALAGVVGLTVAVYQQAFTPMVTVVLEADRSGNQLSVGGDVKARGLRIGEVRDVSSTGSGARIELALQPEVAGRLPSDLRAQMLPKTLFGEKYVALVFDDASTAPPLADGDVISQDGSETARETTQALDDLLPLLQTLRPQQLSVTLNALSTALRGRGEAAGQNLELVESYLGELNPELPTLEQDVSGLADLADNLERARPDVLRLLDDLAEINRDLTDQEQQLNGFLTATTGVAGELAGFVEQNDDRLIRLAADSLPPLRLYATYSPEYPCLARALDEQRALGDDSFGGGQPGLHITLELTQDQRGYRPGDEPQYGEDRGPTCRGLPPNPRIVPFPVDQEVSDGYCDEQEQAPGIQNGCRHAPPPPDPRDDPARALAGPVVERAVIGAAVGPIMGLAPHDVPDAALLLFGPLARGTELSLSSRAQDGTASR